MRTNLNDLATDSGDVYWGRIFKVLLTVMILGAVLMFVGAYIGWGLGWGTLPAEKYSAENVQREYAWFYGMHEQIRANQKTMADLEAQRAAIRDINGTDTTRWAASVRDEQAQLQRQALQVGSALNIACGEYEAKWRNVFHSMAAPSDIPRSCNDIR